MMTHAPNSSQLLLMDMTVDTVFHMPTFPLLLFPFLSSFILGSLSLFTDDILPKLMASSASPDDLFRKELTKYDRICEEIAQNIEAQENLLLQIHAQNDDFAVVFNLEDYKVSRDRCYKQIAAAIAKYTEIKDNISVGLTFYVTLQDAITKVKQQCRDFVTRRNNESDDMIEEVKCKIAGLKLMSYYDDPPPEIKYNTVPLPPLVQPSAYCHPSRSDYTRQGYTDYQSYTLPPYGQQIQSPYLTPAVLYPHIPERAHGQSAYPGWRRQYARPPSHHAPHYPPPQSGYYGLE